jgi:hypothetical protein
VEIVQANPEKPWNYESLSENPNITWEIVDANPQIPWDFHLLSMNPNISFDVVEQNPQIPWSYHNLSVNTMDNVKDKFIQSRVKQYFMTNVAVEIENHCLHPDNFFKLYELGHHEHMYQI